MMQEKTKMKAAVATRYGDVEVLEIQETDIPKVSPKKVLIEVHASSVNPIDWKLYSGAFRFLVPLKFPAIMGFDLCGKVIEVGKEVTRFKAGDWVMSRSANKTGEAYAEFALIDESALAIKPDSLSVSEAAALPLAGLTAYEGLMIHGKLKSGNRVLINGASGGVGSMAVQIAKTMGTHVTSTCSTKNVDFVRSLGADCVVDYTQDNVLAQLDSFDLVFDAVGKFSFGKVKPRLKPEGLMVTTQPSPRVLLSTTLGWIHRGKRAIFFTVQPNGKRLETLGRLCQEGKIKITIDSEYPLAQIADAHRRSQTNRARGKIVVKIREAVA